MLNLVSDRVEDQSREKAKANTTYCVTISHGMRIVRLRRSKKNRGKLNGIVHPAVYHHFENWAQQFNSNTLIFNESALLIETGSFKRFDKIILITAPVELKIKRLTQRENSTKEEIILRMKSQLSDKEKKNYADYLIENNEIELLLPQIIRVLDQLNKDCSTL